MSGWLITGAAGFLGAHVMRRLRADGLDVVGLDGFDAAYDPALEDARARWVVQRTGASLLRCDVTSLTETVGGVPVTGLVEGLERFPECVRYREGSQP